MLSMNDAGEIHFRIRPLDDSNFPQWSKEIKVILLERNLWEIVTEKEVEPDIKDVKLKEQETQPRTERQKKERGNIASRSPSGENLLMEVLTTEIQQQPWIFDTAATSHFCNSREMFLDDFVTINNQILIGAVDDQTTVIKGKGTVKLMFGHVELLLRDVMYTPKLRRNLISGPCIDQKGAKFVGNNGKIDIFRKNGKLLCTAKLYNGLYYIFPDKCLNLSDDDNEYQSDSVHNVNEMCNLNVSNENLVS
ncbi:hypothetical protein HNY73_002014 [Argiope bruennichi]|uniref:Retrovirus-related Pol polyprotein from transposon TNT 1-94-like beta-barrel domain-containing protein n=1 Tax=Argiope bruennichi TaxID=94029 RepID=A0A8T0FWH4_ARGBR|nr:hypothetical protein HNY73_002014 [Argiope bruennichi]